MFYRLSNRLQTKKWSNKLCLTSLKKKCLQFAENSCILEKYQEKSSRKTVKKAPEVYHNAANAALQRWKFNHPCILIIFGSDKTSDAK